VFGGALSYTGFGGAGKQVRDLLHPHDLYELVIRQMETLSKARGEVYAVGGGVEGSVSLLEYTRLCEQVTGSTLQIKGVPETAAVDIPYFVMDSSRAQKAFGWKPTVRPAAIVAGIYDWLRSRGDELRPLFQ
jgi:CDP-paratose 2-epimerase